MHISDDEEVQSTHQPQPAKYERYDKPSFIKTSTKGRSGSVSQMTFSAKAKLDNKTQTSSKQPAFSNNRYRRENSANNYSRTAKKNSIRSKYELNHSVSNDHSNYAANVPQSSCHAKMINLEYSDGRDTHMSSRKSKINKRPLNFRSIKREKQAKSKVAGFKDTRQGNNSNKNKEKAVKNTAKKAQKLKKTHISHLVRCNPLKYRIIAFAQNVAAKKIQNSVKKTILSKRRVPTSK